MSVFKSSALGTINTPDYETHVTCLREIISYNLKRLYLRCLSRFSKEFVALHSPTLLPQPHSANSCELLSQSAARTNSCELLC